jgi:hypothetical protein
LAVEHALDDVLGVQLVVCDHCSDGPRGSELHLFVDHGGAHVQRAAEDTGERKPARC